MSALTLRLRERPPARVDLSAVTPEALAEIGVAAVGGLTVWCGRRRLALGELFEIGGDDPDDIVLEDACERLDGIGTGLSRGRIRVEGDAGFHVGRAMRGGSIEVSGNCGALAASAMRGGVLMIGGNAGDSLGGPRAGERRGMSGGLVLVRGNAGMCVGERMRRGTILIEGDTGAACGARMIAGSIGVLGRVGENCAVGMRRGSLLLARSPQSLPATFHGPLSFEAGFLPLAVDAWRGLQGRFAALPRAVDACQRLVGDRAVAGLGEILIVEAWGEV